MVSIDLYFTILLSRRYPLALEPVKPDILIFTGRNEVVAKVIFLHLFVILFTGGGGVCLSARWDTLPPRTRQTPPPPTPRDQADTPPGPGRHPPGPGRHPPRTRQTPPPPTPRDQADTPPGPGRHPPGPGRHPPGPGRHPPPREADSSIRSTSSRYASYWNAFLFVIFLQYINTNNFSLVLRTIENVWQPMFFMQISCCCALVSAGGYWYEKVVRDVSLLKQSKVNIVAEVVL